MQGPPSRFVAGSVVADEVDVAHVVVGQAADHGVDVHLFLDPLPGGLVGTVLENSFLQGDVLELDPSGHLLVEHGTGGREGHLLELGLGFLALLEERHVEAVYLDGELPVLIQTLGHVAAAHDLPPYPVLKISLKSAPVAVSTKLSSMNSAVLVGLTKTRATSSLRSITAGVLVSSSHWTAKS